MSDPVALAFIALLTLLIKVWWDVRVVHKTMNSRLDQLLEAHGRDERSIGREEGREEGRKKI